MADGSKSDGINGSTRVLIVVAVLLICCCGGIITALVPLGEMMSAGKRHYNLQCDIALGPEPGASPSPTTTTTTARPEPMTPRPTANPYAELNFDPNDPNVTDRDLACQSAMKSAPLQDEPWQQVNASWEAVCAAELAQRYPEAGGTATMADYARDVIYSASIYRSTGQCVPTRAPAAVAMENCGDPSRAVSAVVLPAVVGDQGYCGQLVAPEAASAGDLVFWEYRDRRATRVGIALGPRELVTVDSGKFVRLALPEGAEVQIKRVLGAAA
ncbi:hypothetical protein ACWCPQ_28115 [Nocardia sp. NPDC001965]